MKTKQKSKLYILPGWGEKVTDPNYKRIIDFVSKKYDFVPLKVATRNRKYSLGSDKSVSEILDNIEKQIVGDCSNDVLLGFSIGALQAFLIAQNLIFGKVIICSMSPVLGSDISFYPKESLKDITNSQLQELKKLKYPKLKSKNIVLLFGSEEFKFLKDRSKSLGKRIGYKVVEVKGSEHDLDETYFNALKKFL